MSRLPLLLLVMLVWGFEGGTLGQNPLRIGSWNIKDFGQSKMAKPVVVNTIVQVMRRYDIIVILEVSDINGNVPGLLLNQLNSGITDPYLQVTSNRVGRRSHKEQYVFYWKPSRVTYVSDYTFNDPNDQFEYDPFVVEFELKVNNMPKKFGFIAIHATPRDAVREIDALVDVYFDFRSNKNIGDVMIMGDFNAGGRYVRPCHFPNIRLCTDPHFHWLTANPSGSSVGTYEPYDRIVVADNTLNSLTQGLASVYYFDAVLGLTKPQALLVSDHYPIETTV